MAESDSSVRFSIMFFIIAIILFGFMAAPGVDLTLFGSLAAVSTVIGAGIIIYKAYTSEINSAVSSAASGAYNVGSSAASGLAQVPGRVGSTVKTGLGAAASTGYGVGIFIGLLALGGAIAGLYFSNGGTGTIMTFAKYVGAFLGFFLLVLLLSFISSKQERPGQFLPTALLRMLYYFLPYGLITFATLSDMFNFEYKYFGGILTAIGAFIANYLLSKMAPGDQPTIDSNYCGIPGLSIFGSKIFPQGMLFNLTTLSYLATLLTLETNQNQKYTIPSWTFLIAMFGISAFTTNYNECFNEKGLNNNHGYLIVDFFKSKNFSQNMGVTFLNMATLAAALGFGASGAAIHYFGVMRREAFAGHINPKDAKEAKDKQDENIVNVSTALSEVCPAIAEDQIVAEIYQNGKKLGSSQNN